MMRNRAALGWSCAVGGAVFAEWRALHHKRIESTLSAATRATFRTDTPHGRLVFVISWAALTLWWLPHILDGREPS